MKISITVTIKALSDWWTTRSDVVSSSASDWFSTQICTVSSEDEELAVTAVTAVGIDDANFSVDMIGEVDDTATFSMPMEAPEVPALLGATFFALMLLFDGTFDLSTEFSKASSGTLTAIVFKLFVLHCMDLIFPSIWSSLSQWYLQKKGTQTLNRISSCFNDRQQIEQTFVLVSVTKDFPPHSITLQTNFS